MISLLSYSNSRDANNLSARTQAAANAAAKKQDAEQMSWYPGPGNTLVIVNSSDTPVDYMELYREVGIPLQQRQTPKYDDVMVGQPLPACSLMTIYFSRPLSKADHSLYHWPQFMANEFDDFTFENRDGAWELDIFERLGPYRLFISPLRHSRYFYQLPPSSVTIAPAPTCSPSTQAG